jgi:uncharacterized protein (TIGR03435 family)
VRLLFWSAVLACGQAAFEVASVKPTVHRARAVGTVRTFPGGRVTVEGSTLEHLLEIALDVQRFQVAGGQDWMYIEGFDVEAKPPAASGSGRSTGSGAVLNEEQRQMLLALLAERFQLQYHRETRQGLVYFLARTNNGLKLKDAKNRDVLPWVLGPETGIAGGNVSMPLFARRLSRWLDRPVFDRTGLDGSYDFKFEYDSSDPGRDVASAILVSLQGLGLKLEPGKGTVETIVVDRVERPSGN